ncbi:hypothetical protein E2C01_098579 [Portunus trituberculatus]|uniref:Uncharacterized protein n=1 Tax=Portunus trituberculatus TaxID=210409 RepID=A0A5B7KDA0_PORTR|nr:hypothetical protein [Portunus trituberculatus]
MGVLAVLKGVEKGVAWVTWQVMTHCQVSQWPAVTQAPPGHATTTTINTTTTTITTTTAMTAASLPVVSQVTRKTKEAHRVRGYLALLYKERTAAERIKRLSEGGAVLTPSVP